MLNDNQLVIEKTLPYESMYVITQNDLNRFQAGEFTINDLHNRRIRVPVFFSHLDTPTNACDTPFNIRK